MGRAPARPILARMNDLHRRDFLRIAGLGAAALAFPPVAFAQDVPLEELTIDGMRRYSARQLTQAYLARIAKVDESINSIIELNPDALAIADLLDRERAAGRTRGPLHGIPILIKDNIDTADRMRTSAGSLALAESTAKHDAHIVRRLREAGAVLLGKTNLSEWANFRSTKSTSGWSGRGGLTRNPYALDRNCCGSSSGSGAAIAASLAAVAVGTETDGSIVCPSSSCGLVGLKPTLGLVSRSGIIPIAHSQDTAGPMTRTVTDAAILLGVLEGPDPNDKATSACAPQVDYTKFLQRDGLKGARIGIPRAFFYDKFTPPGEKEGWGGLNDDQKKVVDEAVAVLKAQGAVVIDPADIPSVVDQDPKNNFLLWGVCTDMDEVKARKCSIDLAYGMERDFNAWLASLGDKAPVKTLTELREWNVKHQKMGTIRYGQSLLDLSDAMDLELFGPRYQSDRANDIRLAGTLGIDAVMKQHDLDAILFPGSWGAGIAARPGYPTVMVPFGMVPNAPKPEFPETFKARPTPFGISFTGGACSEPALLKIAYAFEQATRRRVPPPAMP